MSKFFSRYDPMRLMIQQIERVPRLYRGDFLGNLDASRTIKFSMVDKYQFAQDALTRQSWDNVQQALGLSASFTQALEDSSLRARTLSGLEAMVHDLNLVLPHLDGWADRHWRHLKQAETLLGARSSILGALDFTPTQLFTETIATLDATLRSVSVDHGLRLDITALPDCFLGFARDQLHRIARDEETSPERAQVAATVLEYSRAIHLEHAALTTRMLESSPSQDEHSGPTQPSNCNVLRVLNGHAGPMYAGFLEADGEALASLLPEQIRQTGVVLVDLVLTLNELQAGTGPQVFQLTTRFGRAILRISDIIAVNEMRFADVVDHLYFLFHEATGKSKSLKALSNGVDMEALPRVTRLRHYFRHDFGNDRRGEVQYAETSEIFERLIGKKRPISAADWKRAQLALYVELVSMLEGIRDFLIRS